MPGRVKIHAHLRPLTDDHIALGSGAISRRRLIQIAEGWDRPGSPTWIVLTLTRHGMAADMHPSSRRKAGTTSPQGSVGPPDLPTNDNATRRSIDRVVRMA